MVNVSVYLDSAMDAATVLEFGADHVAIATGARWRGDGVGRNNRHAIPGATAENIYTPDHVMDGVPITGPVLVFDDDSYYMGGVVAEKLRRDGLDVTLMTPDADVSSFTNVSLEQHRIQSTLLSLGVRIITRRVLSAFEGSTVRSTCVYTGQQDTTEFASVVLVTALLPRNDLYDDLCRRRDDWSGAGINSITRIGDAEAPGIIAAAVWSGHRYGRDLGQPKSDGVPFKRELTEIVSDWP
jgi:dimethylamine/trimethylamine dehydrogenase